MYDYYCVTCSRCSEDYTVRTKLGKCELAKLNIGDDTGNGLTGSLSLKEACPHCGRETIILLTNGVYTGVVAGFHSDFMEFVGGSLKRTANDKHWAELDALEDKAQGMFVGGLVVDLGADITPQASGNVVELLIQIQELLQNPLPLTSSEAGWMFPAAKAQDVLHRIAVFLQNQSNG